MDILLISKYILIIALIFLMFVSLRVGAYKFISMGLISASVLTVAIAFILLIFGDLYSIEYTKDIALALILFGFVGTIAFAAVIGGDN